MYQRVTASERVRTTALQSRVRWAACFMVEEECLQNIPDLFLEVDEYQDAHLEIFGIWLQPVSDHFVVAKSIHSNLSVVFFSGVIRISSPRCSLMYPST